MSEGRVLAYSRPGRWRRLGPSDRRRKRQRPEPAQQAQPAAHLCRDGRPMVTPW